MPRAAGGLRAAGAAGLGQHRPGLPLPSQGSSVVCLLWSHFFQYFGVRRFSFSRATGRLAQWRRCFPFALLTSLRFWLAEPATAWRARFSVSSMPWGRFSFLFVHLAADFFFFLLPYLNFDNVVVQKEWVEDSGTPLPTPLPTSPWSLANYTTPGMRGGAKGRPF